MAEIRENKKRLPLWRRVFLCFVIAAMVMVAGVMTAAYVAEKRLGREVIRISRAGEPVAFPDLYVSSLPRQEPLGQTQAGNTEDAAGCYTETIERINPAELANLVKVNVFYRTNMVSVPLNRFPADLRETVEKNLSKSELILANLDKGAGLALSGFNIGITQGRKFCMARLDSVQGAVFLSSLRTLHLILVGDGDEAAKSIISTLKLIRVFDVSPTMLVQTRKMVCVRLACSDIQMLLVYSHPSEDQLKTLQSLLLESFRSDMLEKTLLAERVYQLEVARNLIPRNVTSRYLMAEAPDIPERLALPEFTWHRMRVFSRSARYLRDMARFIVVSRRPWPGPLDETMNANEASSEKQGGLTSVMAPLARLTAETLAMVRCASTAVAIERYHRQHGGLPDSLEVIAPQYIESVLLDPFTGKPLLYGRDGDSYTIYSVGINRIDDKGAVAAEPNEQAVLDTGVRIRPATAK